MADLDLHLLELNLHPDEASGLLTVEDESLLESHGWEIEDCVAILMRDFPAGGHTVATHFRAVLPPGAHSGPIDAEAVRECPDLPRVEGIAIAGGGRFFCVTDGSVDPRLTRLLAE